MVVYGSQERGALLGAVFAVLIRQHIYGSMTYEDTYIQQHKDTYVAVCLSYSGSVGSEKLFASSMRTPMQQYEDTCSSKP